MSAAGGYGDAAHGTRGRLGPDLEAEHERRRPERGQQHRHQSHIQKEALSRGGRSHEAGRELNELRHGRTLPRAEETPVGCQAGRRRLPGQPDRRVDVCSGRQVDRIVSGMVVVN